VTRFPVTAFGALWVVYAVAFSVAIRGLPLDLAARANAFIAFNSYVDLTLNAFLGYAMIVVLMEDAKREFDELGLMRARHASINDLPIAETERKFRWPQGRRPDDHPGLSDLGL